MNGFLEVLLFAWIIPFGSLYLIGRIYHSITRVTFPTYSNTKKQVSYIVDKEIETVSIIVGNLSVGALEILNADNKVILSENDFIATKTFSHKELLAFGTYTINIDGEEKITSGDIRIQGVKKNTKIITVSLISLTLILDAIYLLLVLNAWYTA